MDGVADTPEKMDRYVRTIYNKTNEMDHLINELTFYSKIDTNRIPYTSWYFLSTKYMIVPIPRRLVAHTFPPWSSRIFFTMEKVLARRICLIFSTVFTVQMFHEILPKAEAESVFPL